MASDKEDYYSVLGVSRSANDDEIKKVKKTKPRKKNIKMTVEYYKNVFMRTNARVTTEPHL